MAEEKKKSLLEKSLSLSENGGIYYGGARVKSNPKSAVLFVGLGGSGADALIRIKDQIKTRMILPSDDTGAPVADAPKNIGFLEIDTDAEVQKMSYGTAKFDSFGNEFCDISVKSVPEVIADIKKEKERGIECWQWFDDGVNQVSGAHGAGGIRQIGRMLLMNNIDRVINEVEGKITSLINDDAGIKELLVYVFSGMSGGTGAGTFLDMAYILRKIAQSKIPTVNMMGYLVMTSVNETNGGNVDALRTNGFSCLKELDYWMSSAEHEERYYQSFPNGFVLNELTTPFDFCHLLDAADADGHQFSYNKILRSVAENTFAYVAGEVSANDTATGTMAALYSNINEYIRTLTGTSKYPGCYKYLSLGASKIEIPYTEISTLIAARVFERLNAGMFQNRPTEEQFNRTVYTNLQMTEENIRSALYREVNAPRPILDDKSFKFKEAYSGNVPFQSVHNWLALFQRAVVQQAGNLPAALEGNLKEFIKNNLTNYSTGPVYLRYYVESNQNYCLSKMLKGFRTYCLELQAQCAGRSKGLHDTMSQYYAEGKKSWKLYLSAVETWYKNEEAAFLNEKIAEVIEKLQARLDLYYKNILKPLTEILLELPEIFAGNVEYIRVQEDKVDEGTDILIRPLEFERTNKNAFDAAVAQAEQQFLTSLSGNIKKWIGRDIDNVDENISTSIDVAGFISNFISENFQSLLTINMEAVMNTKLRNGQSLNDYIRLRVDELLQNSFPMYKEGNGLAESKEEFAVISVPGDCAQILATTRAHIKAKNLDKRVTVKQSDEKSRMYIIKIASGYPLYSNAYISGMETAYEKLMGNKETRAGKHLKYEWYSLPSPYIEPAWKPGYVCDRTKDKNEKYRAYFDRCRNSGLIQKSESGDYILRCTDPDVVKKIGRHNLTAPTILGKLQQFETVKGKFWAGGNSIILSKCGSYMSENAEDGDILNIRENILRFPVIMDALKKECELADELNQIEEELYYPKYFALANANHMILKNKITGDHIYRRIETDPFPIELTKGHEIKPDFEEYQVYVQFCKVLTQEFKDEINFQYSKLKICIESDPDALHAYVDEIEKRIQIYKREADKAQQEMYNVGSEERPSYHEKIEFYKYSIEEMNRILPERGFE